MEKRAARVMFCGISNRDDTGLFMAALLDLHAFAHSNPRTKDLREQNLPARFGKTFPEYELRDLKGQKGTSLVIIDFAKLPKGICLAWWKGGKVTMGKPPLIGMYRVEPRQGDLWRLHGSASV